MTGEPTRSLVLVIERFIHYRWHPTDLLVGVLVLNAPHYLGVVFAAQWWANFVYTPTTGRCYRRWAVVRDGSERNDRCDVLAITVMPLPGDKRNRRERIPLENGGRYGGETLRVTWY